MRRLAVLVPLALGACSGSAPFEGLAAAAQTGGPQVVFDLSRRPLPEIPFPNDLATRPDPGSPTGLRVNGSLVAPTQLERSVRARLDQLDGFGTFAPISVAFDLDHPLDVLDLYNRQNNSDPADDGVYIVDLVTGETTPLDFNGGHFPYTLNNPAQYFLNDPLTGAYNLLFPVSGPAPNFFQPAAPHVTVQQQADDLITFYERATNTLVLRPVIPLRQERRYAVVLTDRIHGTDGKAISSPHSGINHAAQTAELKPLLGLLPAGTPLEHVAYTWAFTTQSTTRDLEMIYRGLHGAGPLAPLSIQYPVQQGNSQGNGYGTLLNVLQERGAFDPSNPSTNLGDYILPVADLTPLLNDPDVKKLLLGSNDQAVQALLDTFKYVDYFVSGTFISPSFLDVQTVGEPADQAFQIDPATGAARTQNATITFIMAVPKERPEVGHLAPFPVVIAGHGYQSTRIEHVLGFGGTFAKFGLATIAIDAYGHGIGIDPVLEAFGRLKAHQYGLDAFADAVFRGRARDLDYDGIKDPGGDFWTADTFHTRDVVRQSVVDWMQLVRLLRSFDGHGAMLLGGALPLAGDFNDDGIPDVGGPPLWPADVCAGTCPVLNQGVTCSPNANGRIFCGGQANPGGDLFVFGISLGGILSGILPAVEPAIVAAAPASGAGGLADVGIRSTLNQVVQAVFLELFGPLFATCPFSASSGPTDAQTGMSLGACSAGASDAQNMLVLVVQDVNRERDIPIAPLTLQPGQGVMVRNLAQTTAAADCSAGQKIDGCSYGVADAQGQLRLPIAADWPSLTATRTQRGAGQVDLVKVQVLQPGDPLQVIVSGQVIDKFQVATRFYGVDYKPLDPLVSPARGYGTSRNTPEFRRLMQLSQLILEPGDPVNYAPYYFQQFGSAPAAGRARDCFTPDNVQYSCNPANALVIATSGDPGVPVNTGIALARAAGLVEMTQPDPAYGIPVDQVLVRSGAVEGVPGTHRFDDPLGGVFAALPGHVRCDSGSTCSGDVLIDPTGYSCDANGANCTDQLGAPRLSPPLRQQLTRASGGMVPCPVSARSQIASGCWSTNASSCAASAPTTASGPATSGPGISALLIPYLNREGQHGFLNPQPQKPFDMDQFMANLVGRYFECRGTELHFEKCQQDLASCPWIPAPPP